MSTILTDSAHFLLVLSTINQLINLKNMHVKKLLVSEITAAEAAAATAAKASTGSTAAEAAAVTTTTLLPLTVHLRSLWLEDFQ